MCAHRPVRIRPSHLDEINVDSFEELTGGTLVEDVDFDAFHVDFKDGLVDGHQRQKIVEGDRSNARLRVVYNRFSNTG